MANKNFIPSHYQCDIFNFVAHGHGNAVIEAVPGAGKTHTLLECLRYIPKNAKVLIAAFNTDIVNELNGRINNIENKPDRVECRTLHSLGKRILISNHKEVKELEPSEYKYVKYISQYLSSYKGEDYTKLTKSSKKDYAENVKKFVDFGRYFLCKSEKGLKDIEEHYNINTLGEEKKIALEVLKIGKEDLTCIDFTDMIWLPNVLNCKPYDRIYDWILVDEAQDLEKQERELLFKCTKMSTRMLVFGEKQQQIYSFKGGDEKSFSAFLERPNTQKLPLSITYRCSQAVVRFLRRFNDKIEASDTAPEGEVKFKSDIDELKDGDMVLCRSNAPLFELYSQLAEKGITAYIKGKDLGNNLVKLIEDTKETELSSDFKKEGLFPHLYNNLFTLIDSVMTKGNITFEMAIENSVVIEMYDKIMALEAIVGNLKTVSELIDKVKGLFCEGNKKGVSLSTIHKAKGLEADNVYICCPSLLPSRSAKLPWEIEEERNLEYVAYSRPKIKLGFLNEDNMSQYSMTMTQKKNRLDDLKLRVMWIYGGETRCSAITPTVETAELIIENAKEIEIPTGNIKSMDSVSNNVSMSMFKTFSKKKKR